MKDEFYRPPIIEFDIAPDGSNMPESFGSFESAEEAQKELNSGLIAINHGITVSRHMDAKEKAELREECADVMENSVPVYEGQLSEAENNLEKAKKLLKSAEEAYDFVISRAKNLANEAKRGLKEIKLDELFTYRIAYKGRFYFYTYIDKSLKLCYIRDMAESEKTEIWNQMAQNEEYIDQKYKKESKKVKP